MLKQLQTSDFDYIIDFIDESKKPIESALKMLQIHGEKVLHAVFLRAVEISRINVSNAIYKAILCGKFYRVNMFIKEYQIGNACNYLKMLSIEEKLELIEDFATKVGMCESSLSDLEILNSLVQGSINDSNQIYKMKIQK